MTKSGWVVEGDHVKLRDDSSVQIVSQLLTSHLLDKEVKNKESLPIIPSASPTYELPVEQQKELFIAIGSGDILKC